MNTNEEKITGKTLIVEIMDRYPILVNFLIEEYGFHCMTCFLAEYEKLEEGARVHGITGSNFEELVQNCNDILSGDLEYIV